MDTLHDYEVDYRSASVADIALLFPNATHLLDQYGLDFCCQGKQSFFEACLNAGLQPESIWSELQVANQIPVVHRMKFETWDAHLLMDFILQHHHAYVRETIPQVQGLLDKVCEVHGSESSYLLEVRDTFRALADELLNHLPKEEEIVFPAIRKILAAGDAGITSFVQTPVQLMENEHDRAGDLLKKLRILTEHYTPPRSACPTFQMTYQLLQEFDQDLIQHIHLENNLLFPKVKV